MFPPEQLRLFHEIVKAKQRSPLTRVPHHAVSAMRDLAARWRADGLPHLDERVIGLPEMPMTLEAPVGMWMLRLEVTRSLTAESVSPKVLRDARAEFRVEWARYQDDRAQLQGRAGASAGMFALPEGTEAQARGHVDAFTTTLGCTSGLAEPIFAEVRAALRRR